MTQLLSWANLHIEVVMAGKVGVQDEFLDPVGSRIEQNILGKNSLINVALGTANNKLRSFIMTNTPSYERLPLSKKRYKQK